MPEIIFGGGKTDITDRPNRQLGQLQVNSNIVNFSDLFNTCFKITVDGQKIVATDSAPFIGNVKKMYYNVPIIEFSNSPANACLAKRYILEIDGTVHFVDDIRHSQNLDLEDNTYFGDTYGSLTIDYGSVYTFKQVYIKTETRTSNTAFSIRISSDGTNYTAIHSRNGASLIHHNFYDLTFRYLSFECTVVQPGGGSSGFRVYKIILIR
jgi:hypothetical protein